MRLDLSTCQLTAIDENGFIGSQVDGLGESGVTPDQLTHAFGFVSRPRDPEDGLGCSQFHYQSGSSERYCWLGDDPRFVDKHPPIKKGGAAFYCAHGSFWNLDGEDGTATCYVPYASDKAHLATIGLDGNGKPIIEFASGTGAAWTLLDGVTTFSNDSGSAYLEINPDGINAVGPFKAAGGADIGGPGSLPLVKFAPLSSELTAIQNALTAITGALTALAAVPTNSSAGAGPAAAAVTAVGTALAALSVFTATGATVFVKGA